MSDENLRGRFRRDFTKEPIRAQTPELKHHQPLAQAAASEEPVSPPSEAPRLYRETLERKPKRIKKLIIALILLLVLASVASGGRQYYKSRQIVPSSIITQYDRPILYPTKLPAGFKVIKNSFSVTSGNIVTYYAADHSNNRINFTIQARPANFNFDAFYAQTLTGQTKFTTPLGEAAVGTAGGHLLGSLATSKSWAIVTGNNQTITADKIQTAISSMASTGN